MSEHEEKSLLEVADQVREDLAKAREPAVVDETMVEEDVTTDEESSDVDPIEAEAREKGWKPREEFDGDEEGKSFVSAKEYVERGKFYKTISTQGREIKELKTVIGQFSDHMKRAEKAAFEKAAKELEARQRMAVSDGDIDEYDNLNREAAELQKRVKEVETKTDPFDHARTAAAVEEFKERNTWFNPESSDSKTIAMTAFAQTMSDRIAASHPDLTADESLARVEDEVRRVYPEHFRNTRQDLPSPVMGTKGARSSRKKGIRLNDLPEEFQRSGRKFIKMIPGYTEERYIKELIEQGVITNDK